MYHTVQIHPWWSPDPPPAYMLLSEPILEPLTSENYSSIISAPFRTHLWFDGYTSPSFSMSRSARQAGNIHLKVKQPPGCKR